MNLNQERRLVIIDLYDVGHHPTFLEAYVRAAKECYGKVLVISPAKPSEDCEWREIVPKIEGFLPRIIGRGRIFEVYRMWWISKLVKEFSPDTIFFACAYQNDFRHFPFWRKFFPGAAIGGLILNVWKKVEDVWTVGISGGNFGKFDYILTLDPTAVDELQGQVNSRVSWLPELGEMEIAEQCGLSERIEYASKGRKIVFLGGFLTSQKGVYEFSRLVRGMNSEDYFFVIVGQLSLEGFTVHELGSIFDFFESHENVFTHLIRVGNDRDFNKIMSISSVVVAAFRDWPNSSNTIIKAGMLGIPVVVSKGFGMASIVENYNIGVSANAAAPLEFATAVEEAARKKWELNESFRELHSFESFARSFERGVMGGDV